MIKLVIALLAVGLMVVGLPVIIGEAQIPPNDCQLVKPDRTWEWVTCPTPTSTPTPLPTATFTSTPVPLTATATATSTQTPLPTPTSTPVPLANLALNKLTTASSVEVAGFEAAKATDGNSTTTRWASLYSDPQWLMVDLGQTYNVSEVRLTWEDAYASSYQLQVSNDAVSWTSIFSTTTSTGGTEVRPGLTGTGRYIRMYGTVRATGWGYSLWEMEVYGTTAPVDCGTSLQSRINSATANSILDLAGCHYTGTIDINKALTIKNGQLTTPPTSNIYSWSVSVNANNVTIDNMDFIGGGTVISVGSVANPRQNLTVLNSTFEGQSGMSIAIWDNTGPVHIEGNVIKQTVTTGVSPIIAHGQEGCTTRPRDLTLVNNNIDSGSYSAGWFGAELTCTDRITMDGNTHKGGVVLVSLPRSKNVIIRNSTFDMRNDILWGIEAAQSEDVSINNNTFIGMGAGIRTPNPQQAVSENSGALRTTVSNNTVSNTDIFVGLGGDVTTITNNCLTNVTLITAYTGTNVTLTNNGPC